MKIFGLNVTSYMVSNYEATLRQLLMGGQGQLLADGSVNCIFLCPRIKEQSLCLILCSNFLRELFKIFLIVINIQPQVRSQ